MFSTECELAEAGRGFNAEPHRRIVKPPPSPSVSGIVNEKPFALNPPVRQAGTSQWETPGRGLLRQCNPVFINRGSEMLITIRPFLCPICRL